MGLAGEMGLSLLAGEMGDAAGFGPRAQAPIGALGGVGRTVLGVVMGLFP